MTEARYEITRDIARYSETDDLSHRWTLTVDGETAAELWVSTDTGEIDNIETRPGRQRNGYAAALYRQAATEIQIFHAPEPHRSVDGHAFAEAMGGPTAPHDPNCYCVTAEE